MKKTVLILCAVAALAACGNNSKKNNNTKTETAKATVEVETRTPRNNYDYTGTYKGTIPCADCDGISTELTLNRDNTYTLKSEYKGRSKDVNFEEKGNYKWNDKGDIVILEGVTNSPSRYYVGENALTQLDMNGNFITGEHASAYILKK